jgi:hypothetical protein
MQFNLEIKYTRPNQFQELNPESGLQSYLIATIS